MREWCQLNEVAEINPDTLPGNTDSNFSFRYIHLGAVDRGTIDWNLTTATRFGDAPSRARRIVQPGDTLFGTVRPNLQSHGYIQEKHIGTTVASTGFCVVRPYQAKAVGRYLFHSLMSESVYAQSIKAAIGSNYPAITDRDLQRFNIFLPRLDEQAQIAHILDTLDIEIRRTEEIIAKLEQVKQGLLTDLLTRGIDENGRLRPPPEQAPHLYKDSPLGRIPVEWKHDLLGNVADWFSGGTPSRNNDRAWGGSIPFLTPKDMKRFSIADTGQYITPESAQSASKMMEPETVFVVVRGMILAHTFPVCISEKTLAFNQDIKGIRAHAGIHNRYLAHWLTANAAQFLGKATASTHGTKKLDSSELQRTALAFPSTAEQEMITRRLTQIDKAIAKEKATLNKLRTEKPGLMEDLLTGQVRVTHLRDETERVAG